MARKRLADLLREEANKSTESEAEKPPEANPETRRKPSTRSAKQGDPSSSQSPSTRTAGATKGSSASRRTQVEADDRKAAQEQAQQQEAVFQQKMGELQTELDQQIALTRTLKVDLEKIQPLKAELAQAKKVALQLAEENTRLSQELKALQNQKVPANLGMALTTKEVSQKAPPVSSAAIATKEAMQRQQARVLAHPIFPTDPLPGQISDQDLGWVD